MLTLLGRINQRRVEETGSKYLPPLKIESLLAGIRSRGMQNIVGLGMPALYPVSEQQYSRTECPH